MPNTVSPSWVVLDHLGGLAAQQDVDDLPGPEALPALPVQPEHGRQELLRGHGSVHDSGGVRQVVAVAARLG